MLVRVLRPLSSAPPGSLVGIPKVIDLTVRAPAPDAAALAAPELSIVRCPQNPIVAPGGFDWRKAVTFNPGVVLDGGRFYMYERAAGNLRPFRTCIGALVSDDGIHFSPISTKPVFTSEMIGYPQGSV